MAKQHKHNQKRAADSFASAMKQPLPIDEIQRNAYHAKTADDIPQTGELPIVTLNKEIPVSEVHEQ